MATDRDEQLREPERQRQELEEIRRSFAEMGARMGSLFEPAELDESEPAPQPERPAPPAPAPAPALFAGRPRWWWAAALTLLFLAGTLFGWLLPRDGGDTAAPLPTTPTTAAQEPDPQAPPKTVIKTKISVPESCLDTAEKGDEVIGRLAANIRDNRLAAELRDYTIASQACRREASP
jgi:hypothetical protein